MRIRSVSEITAYIKALLDGDETLADVWIAGEVSNFTRAVSGHCYLTLKDASAELRSVIWRGQAARLPALPRQGDWIEAHGYISVYERGGAYQFYIDLLRPVGIGALWRQFEELKERLQSEGLFDPARKRPLPQWPRRIGIVTSPQAAALQDVLNILGTRYPLVEVVLAGSPVQGMDAPPALVRSIQGLNALGDIDVILLVRGGGSIEDLWAFNDERVARAVAASRVPVVTGVGHEVDFTIVDFVSDLRAPTPTAAAVAVVPDQADLRAQIGGAMQRALALVQETIKWRRESLSREERLLHLHDPRRLLAERRQRLDDDARRMAVLWTHGLEARRMKLDSLTARLQALQPQRVLQRGYAIVQRRDSGARVVSALDVAVGTPVEIYMRDGRLDAEITGASGADVS